MIIGLSRVPPFLGRRSPEFDEAEIEAALEPVLKRDLGTGRAPFWRVPHHHERDKVVGRFLKNQWVIEELLLSSFFSANKHYFASKQRMSAVPDFCWWFLLMDLYL